MQCLIVVAFHYGFTVLLFQSWQKNVMPGSPVTYREFQARPDLRTLFCKFLTMSWEFDKNSSKWRYYSTDHKNYIKFFFEHFPSKLLDPQKSTFGDDILGIKLFLKWRYQKIVFTKVGLLYWYSPMNFFLERFG